MHNLKLRSLIAVAIFSFLTTSAMANNNQYSGLRFNISTGINESSTGVTTSTVTYGSGSTATMTLPGYRSVGANLNMALGYQFAFGNKDGAPSLYFGPELEYKLVGNAPTGVVGIFNGSGKLLDETRSNSSINSVSLNGFIGTYFTNKFYTELRLGAGYFGSSDGLMVGVNLNAGLRAGYDITPNLSVYAEYSSTAYLNVSGTFSSVIIGFGHVGVPDSIVVQEQNIGLQYRF